MKGRYPKFKRLVDLVLVIAALLLLAPVFLIVAALIKVTSPGPVFYTQDRLGLNGKIFKLYKFRSMTNKTRDASVQIFAGSPEVTRGGKIIRRLKIDELAQLFNVLLGDMSIVGPRPCLPDLKFQFNDDGRARLLVRPGLTGLAQINGNIHLDWPQRWAYDRHYVEHYSLWMDIRIIFYTVMIVLLGDKWGLKS